MTLSVPNKLLTQNQSRMASLCRIRGLTFLVNHKKCLTVMIRAETMVPMPATTFFPAPAESTGQWGQRPRNVLTASSHWTPHLTLLLLCSLKVPKWGYGHTTLNEPDLFWRYLGEQNPVGWENDALQKGELTYILEVEAKFKFKYPVT